MSEQQDRDGSLRTALANAIVAIMKRHYGKGPTGAEFTMWGGDADRRQEMFDEAMKIILQGMQNEFVNFDGTHFKFRNLWMALSPYQKPHPPFWYGENAVTAGRLRTNLVGHGSNADVAVKLKKYKAALKESRASWQDGVCSNSSPIYGATRRVYLADSMDEAIDRARASYEVYLTHMFVVFALFRLVLAAGAPMAAIPVFFVAVIAVSAVLGELVSRCFSEPLNRAIRDRWRAGPGRTSAVR